VETLDLRICTASDVSELPQSDLIILSADYPSNLIDWINSECVKRKWAYVNAGYANDISVVGPFYVPGKTGCFRCRPVAPTLCDDAIYPMRDELAAINHGFKPATFAPVNNIAAAIAASDSIKYLGKHGEILSLNRRLGIHSRSIKIEVQDLLKSEDCHVCGTA